MGLVEYYLTFGAIIKQSEEINYSKAHVHRKRSK